MYLQPRIKPMAVSRYPHPFRIFIPTVVSCPGLPQSIRQVAPPCIRYCDAITTHITADPIKFIIRLFGATV